MKKFVTLLAASSLALTMAATTVAKENTAPGQVCAGLGTMAKRNCMRGAIVKHKESQMTNSIKRKFNKREIKQMERERQRTGGTSTKVKSILTDYRTSTSSSSAAATSSSASSATSGSAGSGTSSSASSQ